ncbi:ethanolamine ammonia-lyase reactivating factor EutA [Zhaonella formicivorans]|uniref:ethanolamine ammonia-lyase reactivating factor EutA n=1 Tax=Zhaonella formicivorans TaxID=2528593 RepID=UPI00223936B8|nr:ethanolamine ammonia-lyase reactivating factor EutA [Zhaonella formicivorans]
MGIDIGTTTTQLVISRLTIKNTAPGAAVPRMEITDKEVLYKSRIYFTPLLDHQLIDAVAISKIVQDEYRAAGLSPEGIDTGAVIITGETAKKENARNILEAMAGLAGDFVVATAGVNLESILAGKGSGAASFSKEKHRVTVNIDVGGGTANIGVFKAGRTIDTACLNIGGRLIELTRHGDSITYIAEPARAVLRECGLGLSPGDRVTLQQLKTVTAAMARCVVEAVTTRELAKLTRELLMTAPLRLDYPVETVMISGGVADYVYSDYTPLAVSDISRYGDIGPLLGWSLREAFQARGIELAKPVETIRATVIGAGTHSVNISGSTIHVNESTLPLRNVTVVSPFAGGTPETREKIAAELQRCVERLTQDGSAQHVALSIEGPRTETFADIEVLADGIVQGMEGYLQSKRPLVLVLQKDCAKVLGQCLQLRLKQGAEIVCIDQVQVDEGDYIDIGKPLLGGRVVPVVVKTLVFESSGKKNLKA